MVGLGDCCAQQIVEKRGKQHDVRRTIGMSSIGLFVIGPMMRYWYIFLDRAVKGAATSDALKKMVIDQTVFAPTIIAVFFTTTGLLFGKSFSDIELKFRHQYFETMKTNYMIWPFVQIVNFNFVPLQHRVFVVNFIAIFWNTYLSWATNKHEDNIEP